MPETKYQVIRLAKNKNSYGTIQIFETKNEAYDYVENSEEKGLRVAAHRTTWYEGQNV